MWFNRLATVVMLAASGPALASMTPAEVKCPAALDAHRLSRIGMVDGSVMVEAPAEIMDDGSGWNVNVQSGKYISPVFFIKCEYKSTPVFAVVPVPLDAVRCEFHGKGFQIYCR